MTHGGQEPNVILLTADSLRADHVGCCARPGTQGLTPNLDGFAARSVTFTRAFAQGPYTGASLPPLFTGRYACRLKPVGRGQAINWAHAAGVVVDGARTVSEVLKAAGYHTAAFHSNPAVSRLFGFDKGFDVFHDDVLLSKNELPRKLKLWVARFQRIFRSNPYRSARAINRLVLEWLASAREPFFLWVHYMDTHGPYLSRKTLAYVSRGERVWRTSIRSPRKITPEQRGLLLRNYRRQIAYLDAELGTLLKAFHRKRLFERSLVMISADHGDEFFEHGLYGHQGHLYDELLHVPLFVRFPGVLPGRCEELTELIQIPSTVLDFARIRPTAPTGFEAPSFLPVLDRRALPPRSFILSEWGVEPHEGLCIRTKDWKLIWLNRGERKELYELTVDPSEQKNVVAEHPEVIRELERELLAHCSGPQTPLERGSVPAEVSKEEEELVISRLRDLGYI